MPKKPVAVVLVVLLVWSGLVSTASAAVISTREAHSQTVQLRQADSVQAVLTRAEVQQAMVSMGVDPVQAQLRVASLSASELAQLQGQLDTLPAGGVLALIGAVFVVLLILEVTGATDIFKKV